MAVGATRCPARAQAPGNPGHGNFAFQAVPSNGSSKKLETKRGFAEVLCLLMLTCRPVDFDCGPRLCSYQALGEFSVPSTPGFFLPHEAAGRIAVYHVFTGMLLGTRRLPYICFQELRARSRPDFYVFFFSCAVSCH